jgi:hypothetical protein
MASERAATANSAWLLAALALGGLAACRKPGPPPEPPPIESTPTAGNAIAPAEAPSSGSSSDTPP